MREIKETNAYVGPSRKPLEVKVVIGGKSRTLEFGDADRQRLQHADRQDLPGADDADRVGLLRLGRHAPAEHHHHRRRLADPRASTRSCRSGSPTTATSPRRSGSPGQDFQRYVALGALKAARAARENQWQVLLG